MLRFLLTPLFSTRVSDVSGLLILGSGISTLSMGGSVEAFTVVDADKTRGCAAIDEPRRQIS